MSSTAKHRSEYWGVNDLEEQHEQFLREMIASVRAIAARDPGLLLGASEEDLRKVVESTEAMLVSLSEELGCPMLQHTQSACPALAADYERARMAADRKLRLGRAIAGYLLCDGEVLASLADEVVSEVEGFFADRFPLCNFLELSESAKAGLDKAVERGVKYHGDVDAESAEF